MQRWKITRASDNRSVSPDLCDQHSELLEDLFKRLPAGRRGQTRARQVLTEDAVKAKARKRPTGK